MFIIRSVPRGSAIEPCSGRLQWEFVSEVKQEHAEKYGGRFLFVITQC
jgi:hypothetical protein